MSDQPTADGILQGVGPASLETLVERVKTDSEEATKTRQKALDAAVERARDIELHDPQTILADLLNRGGSKFLQVQEGTVTDDLGIERGEGTIKVPEPISPEDLPSMTPDQYIDMMMGQVKDEDITVPEGHDAESYRENYRQGVREMFQGIGKEFTEQTKGLPRPVVVMVNQSIDRMLRSDSGPEIASKLMAAYLSSDADATRQVVSELIAASSSETETHTRVQVHSQKLADADEADAILAVGSRSQIKLTSR